MLDKRWYSSIIRWTKVRRRLSEFIVKSFCWRRLPGIVQKLLNQIRSELEDCRFVGTNGLGWHFLILSANRLNSKENCAQVVDISMLQQTTRYKRPLQNIHVTSFNGRRLLYWKNILYPDRFNEGLRQKPAVNLVFW